MNVVKGTLEATISLSKSTCYFMNTGKCSLNIITDYYVASTTKNTSHDLLYCPRLYRAMLNRERMKPIMITPCECGHAEVVSGHQRACIASMKNLELTIKAVGDTISDACPVCKGQMTFDENTGGKRIVNIRAILHNTNSELI